MQAVFQRAGGVSAIVGGVMRAAGSFAPAILSPSVQAVLYFATDIFLLLGVAGFWLKQRASLGFVGALGLGVFVAGILVIRVTNGAEYQLGAAVALLGVTLYAASTLIARSAAPFAPVAWLAALVFGVAGMLGFAPAAMMLAAGVAFGIGFVAAGLETLGATHFGLASPRWTSTRSI
ncbi:MAG: hypothetical protein JO294_06375 [Alphaproteobacteria bacterium]|nr:hypothetical protein [Alphaproteobacteria bacterium]